MKTTLGLASVVVACAFQLTGGPLAAHHSFAAEFDGTKEFTVKGTIVKMEWVNPHSWLYVDAKGPDGKIQTWRLEFAAPNALYRRGWRRTMLPVGAEVTVRGFPARDGSSTANAVDVILADGRKLFVGSTGTGAPYEGP
jgi:hypothetical protein